MTQSILILDVREDIRSGRQPCGRILETARKVGNGESFKLIAPFEPKPLFELLGREGFTHQAAPLTAGDWEVLFTRKPATASTASTASTPATTEAACGCGCSSTTPGEIVELDARGLEPPQPMVKILEALTELPDQTALHAHTDRRPIHLYAMLEARGFTGQSQEQNDGSFITHIRRC